jgi:hypothetical protein
VEKMTADYVLPAVLLVELAVMLAVHWLVRWLHERWASSAIRDDGGNNDRASINYVEPEHDQGQEEDSDSDGHMDGDPHAHRSEYARYAGALTALVLLMYEGVTSATMDLLNCVPWDGALRLFRAGYVACYAEWQYPLFVLLGGFLVPFPLLLVLLRRWLSSRQRRRGQQRRGLGGAPRARGSLRAGPDLVGERGHAAPARPAGRRHLCARPDVARARARRRVLRRAPVARLPAPLRRPLLWMGRDDAT